ncbi:hypothetical protein [Marinifilum fragile]|uniref:hypothetical protein n=1 Tax=Marinifilum fragile TaxID=570161 RepID=UPI0006CF6926|nr:hypothetical protein [Marinifilum fragile]
MNLDLIKIIDSPLDYRRQAIWISEKRESFLLTDIFKVAEISFRKKACVEILSEIRDKDEAYKIKKPYEERFQSELYDEICLSGKNGFQYLPQDEYDKLKGFTAGSDTFFDITNVFGIHGHELPVQTKKGIILRFLKKEIEILDSKSDILETKYSIPFKNKDITTVGALNKQDLIIYGTNTGKIFLQDLSDNKSKPAKIDDCKSVCYDIEIDENDEFIFICGMGYLRVYRLDNNKLNLISEQKTSARSICIYNDLILLNKGMHGIELNRFNGNEIERLDSLNLGFSIDLMRFNKANETILVSSKPIGKLGLIRITQHNKKYRLLGGLFKFGK